MEKKCVKRAPHGMYMSSSLIDTTELRKAKRARECERWQLRWRAKVRGQVWQINLIKPQKCSIFSSSRHFEDFQGIKYCL